MVAAGWEVASHGWRWIDYVEMPEDDEREHIRRVDRGDRARLRRPPVGWYTGRVSERHAPARRRGGRLPLRLGLVRRRAARTGSTSMGAPHLVVPYTLDATTSSSCSRTGSSPRRVLRLPRRHVRPAASEGGRMMTVGLHCRIVGRPGRAPALARFLAHVKRTTTSGSRRAPTSRATGANTTRRRAPSRPSARQPERRAVVGRRRPGVCVEWGAAPGDQVVPRPDDRAARAEIERGRPGRDRLPPVRGEVVHLESGSIRRRRRTGPRARPSASGPVRGTARRFPCSSVPWPGRT